MSEFAHGGAERHGRSGRTEVVSGLGPTGLCQATGFPGLEPWRRDPLV